MRKMHIALLLQALLIVHCIAEESTDMSAINTDPEGMHKIQQQSESMWAAVRQSLNNLRSSMKSASTNNEVKNSASEEELPVSSNKEDPANAGNDDLPSQMVPIEKGLVYLRPKADERWILNEEGMITWAISNYVQSNADKIYMNGNLYLGDKMIMSVFKGVPLSIGTESWTPPTFLKSSPDYRLRLWSQPSNIGIIDQYSPTFSIVPRKEDAFMFSYNRSVVFDNNKNNKTTAALVPTDKIRVGQNDLPAPSVSEKHGMIIDVNSTPSSINPNLPTGIYALYPSSALHQQYMSISTVIAILLSVIYFSL